MTRLTPGQPVHVCIGTERHRGTVKAIVDGKVLLAFRPAVWNERLKERVSWVWLDINELQVTR